MVKSRKRSRRTRNGKGNGGQNLGSNTQTSYVASPRAQIGFPDRMMTQLSFFAAPSYSPIITASAYAFRYQPTAAFDVEPLLGGITMPGFDEFASIYSSYRVLSSTITVKMIGQSDVGTTLIVVPLNADPGATPSTAAIVSWRGQPFVKSKMVGSKGSAPTTLQSTMTTARMFGSDMVLSDDNFAALVSTVPVNNWFWCVGIYQNITYALNPVLADIQIRCTVQFYDRKYLST